MECIFNRVDVWHMTRGNTQICWELKSQYAFQKSRYHFYIDFGQPGTDEWVTLNEQPIEDLCCGYDTCQRSWSTMASHYYRVRLVLPDLPGCPVYKSEPALAAGHLERSKWLEARKVALYEYKTLINGRAGTQGFLLKRKKFGTACPVCLDWDTKEVRNPDCTTCYGTGLVGGYYPGVDYYVNFNANWDKQITSGDPPRGTTSDVKKSGRCIAYPLIDTRDVWVNVGNDERYIIRGRKTVVEVAGVPIILNAEFRLAPATSIVYSIPIEPDVSSSSVAPGESTTCDVNRGLEDSYEDW